MKVPTPEWIGRTEAAKLTGLHPDKLYQYSQIGLLVSTVTSKKRVFWLASVRLLCDMMREAGGAKGWKRQMRREKQRLAQDSTAVPFWYGRVQALCAQGVPAFDEVEEGWEGMHPNQLYHIRVAAAAIGCSGDTVRSLIREGLLVRARHGRVTGASLMAVMRDVKAAGGYEGYRSQRISRAAKKRTDRKRAALGLCCECGAVLAKAPVGGDGLCGWCYQSELATGKRGQHGRVQPRALISEGV